MTVRGLKEYLGRFEEDEYAEIRPECLQESNKGQPRSRNSTHFQITRSVP